jgi:hypothetical protein
VFDFLLTRDLSRGHILDFNPYHPKTDPLLWTYAELHALLEAATITTTATTTTIPLPPTPTTTTTATPTTTPTPTTTTATASASDNGITTTTTITTEPDIVAPPTDTSTLTPPPPPAAALPILRVIDSAAHPAAARNAPAHQHNMLPFEALDMSSGRDIAQFAGVWQRSVSESMREDEDDSDDA